MGGIDRILRAGAGALMVYFGYFDANVIDDGLLRGVLMLIGAIMIIVASISFCPLYILIDFSSVPENASNE